jgi:hypothetical protein
LRRVALIVVLLLLLLLSRLRAAVVTLLVCHGDAGCVIVYRVQQSHMHRVRRLSWSSACGSRPSTAGTYSS